MSEPAERRIGSVIAGKWRVDALLGSGSMAAVYAVTHRNGARAALKILHPTLCADESVCERFLGEGYVTNSVKHSGIVRVHDDGMTDDGAVFLVMDLLEGRTLEAFRQEQGGQIDLPTVLDIADELMDVLTAVHQAGIVHRDLKPQNVFVCDDGSVKLLDFGVARDDGNGAHKNGSLFGLVLGTPSFMSPEQALGSRDEVDHRSDVWSLGATLFAALTGETVHLGPNVQAKLLAAATVKARSIALAKQDLPSSVALVIDMSLRFKKEDRWQSVDAFRRALRDTRAQLGLGAPRSLPPEWLNDATQPDGPSPTGTTTERMAAAPSAGAVKSTKAGPRKSKRSKTAKFSGNGASKESDGRISATKTLIGVAPPALPSVAPPVVRAVAPSVVRPVAAPVPPSPDDSGDGSYPASPLMVSLDDEDLLMAQVMRRSSSGTVWLVACGLALAIGGGLAFFSMNHSGAADRATTAHPGSSATESETTVTAAAVEPNVLPARIDAKDLAKDAAAPSRSPLKASMTTAEQLRMAHATQPSVTWSRPTYGPLPAVGTTPRTQATPTTTTAQTAAQAPEVPVNQDPPPATAAPAPADPFGTPE